MVAYLLSGLWEISATYSQSTARTLDSFYNGAGLDGIGWADHIFRGSRNLNPTAGRKALGGGLTRL